MRKALYLPGAPYTSPGAQQFAGWWHILRLQKEAIEEAGFDVSIPFIEEALIDRASSFAEISSYSLAVASRVRPEDYDVIVCNISYAHHLLMSLKYASPRAKPKVIGWVWNNADWYREQQLTSEYASFDRPFPTLPINEVMNTTALNLCDAVIACSDFVKATYSKIMPPERIHVAWWGVDRERFRAPPYRPDGFRVLFSGGDVIRKGFRYLTQAISMQDSNEIELWIVGCTPWEEDKKPPSVKQFGLVPFDEVPKIYQQCHVVCIPTLEDGIACAIQEAMATGCVPIATEEAAEVFEDGVSGFQVPYRDSNAISSALARLRYESGLMKKMSRAARDHVRGQKWGAFKKRFGEIVVATVD